MDLTDAMTVLAQMPEPFEHFNEVHLHSNLKMKSPREFRGQRVEQLRRAQTEQLALHCLWTVSGMQGTAARIAGVVVAFLCNAISIPAPGQSSLLPRRQDLSAHQQRAFSLQQIIVPDGGQTELEAGLGGRRG